MKDFWPDLLKVAAAHDPHLRATLARREQQAKEAEAEDRLHRIEVTLDDVVRFGEEENEHMLDLHRSVREQIMDIKRQVRELQRFVSDTDAQLHALYLEQQKAICELRARLAAWTYDRAG